MKKINYPLLDSLSCNAKMVYMFLLLQKNKSLDPYAIAAILHITQTELCAALMEVMHKEKDIA